MDEDPPENDEVSVRQFPNELFATIRKYVSGEDCVALALSGQINGFAEFNRDDGKHVISHKCFYISPTSWSGFFKQYILPNAVTSFNVNHLYWMPPDLLRAGLIQMENLEELCTKDTQVSLPILAEVLNTCSDITKLEFSFRLERDNTTSLESLFTQSFLKLSSLKISSCVHDAKHYRHDPWMPILRFLSLCSKNCVHLSVEITYTGKSEGYIYEDWDDYLAATNDPVEEFATFRTHARLNVYPLLDWMRSLTSLVLIKLGEYANDRHMNERYCDNDAVFSFMLDDLLDWLFSAAELGEDDFPRSLRNFWVQDFSLQSDHRPYIQNSATSLISLQRDRDGIIAFNEPQQLPQFQQLEHVAGIQIDSTFRDHHGRSLAHFPNLKYAHGRCLLRDEATLNEFVGKHPNLESLSVEYYCDNPRPQVQVPIWNLPSLKVLHYSRPVFNAGIIESLVNAHSNLEILSLHNTHWSYDCNFPAETDQELLSLIEFPKLKHLSISKFHYFDGSFLLKIGRQCPKLERVNLMNYCGTSLKRTSFASHFDRFLQFATHLQDFSLEYHFKGDSSFIFSLLKSVLKHSPQLRRFVLLDTCELDDHDSLDNWKLTFEMSDFMVRFALEMPNLICLCISSCQLNSDLIEEVNRRVVEEVLPSKPPLWFWLNTSRPKPSTSNVPLIHYHEVISPSLARVPPKIELIP